MSNGYQITEKDIDTVLNILKRTDPENATPEYAIELLEDIKTQIHLAAHTDFEGLVEQYNKLKHEKKMKTN